MASWLAPEVLRLPLAYVVLNIDPVPLRFGTFAIHWYGIAYVVAIAIAFAVVLRWARREGLHDDQPWGIFTWTAIAGLIGGRLYFVIQQPDLVQNYLLKPLNIFAVWNGGMAFFGAIFAGSATLFLLAPRYGLSRWLALDGGALFAAVGQIFGRFGNIINGDILGQVASAVPITIPASTCASAPCIAYVSDPRVLPWAIVYVNTNSFAPLGIPFQPAPVYEMLGNIVALAILWPLRHTLPHIRAGLFFTLYLALYAISQFVVFFYRGSEPFTPFLGINGLKQAQWTALFVFIASIILYLVVRRFSAPWPYSAKHPVPWPSRSLATHAGAPPGSRATAETASITAGASSTVEADLPPWTPASRHDGRLRNRFSRDGS